MALNLAFVFAYCGRHSKLVSIRFPGDWITSDSHGRDFTSWIGVRCNWNGKKVSSNERTIRTSSAWWHWTDLEETELSLNVLRAAVEGNPVSSIRKKKKKEKVHLHYGSCHCNGRKADVRNQVPPYNYFLKLTSLALGFLHV